MQIKVSHKSQAIKVVYCCLYYFEGIALVVGEHKLRPRCLDKSLQQPTNLLNHRHYSTMTAPTGPRSQTNGVLQISTSQTSNTAAKIPASKTPSPTLKVIVRRLAPALTETEFVSILGEDWQTGKGKVDWLLYKPGKDSKEYDLQYLCYDC